MSVCGVYGMVYIQVALYCIVSVRCSFFGLVCVFLFCLVFCYTFIYYCFLFKNVLNIQHFPTAIDPHRMLVDNNFKILPGKIFHIVGGNLQYV